MASMIKLAIRMKALGVLKLVRQTGEIAHLASTHLANTRTLVPAPVLGFKQPGVADHTHNFRTEWQPFHLAYLTSSWQWQECNQGDAVCYILLRKSTPHFLPTSTVPLLLWKGFFFSFETELLCVFLTVLELTV